jgi:hypothetical protein
VVEADFPISAVFTSSFQTVVLWLDFGDHLQNKFLRTILAASDVGQRSLEWSNPHVDVALSPLSGTA